MSLFSSKTLSFNNSVWFITKVTSLRKENQKTSYDIKLNITVSIWYVNCRI